MAGLALQQAEVVLCPRTMIGRVIGKNGETIKALQARGPPKHGLRLVRALTGRSPEVKTAWNPSPTSLAWPARAAQAFTGAMIQIDQSTDPTKVTVAGEAHSLQTAVDMVKVRACGAPGPAAPCL